MRAVGLKSLGVLGTVSGAASTSAGSATSATNLAASATSPAVNAIQTLFKSTFTTDLPVDNTNLYPPRVVYAEKNRRKLVFKNPATNTETFQVCYRLADNVQNPNVNWASSYTVAPGQELVVWYDEAQWWARQNNAAFVANQTLIVEREVFV